MIIPLLNRLLFLLVVVLAGASTASACPYCDTSIGQQVRAGIFNSDFGYNLAVTLSPFPVLLAIVAVIYFGPSALFSGGHPRGRGDSGGDYSHPLN